jgi:hypothetical protein
MSMERICQRAVAVTGVSQEIMPSYGREWQKSRCRSAQRRATGCTAGIHLFCSVEADCGAHPVTHPMGTSPFPPRIKQLGHEADHSLPSGVEIKKGAAIPVPLLPPNTSSWHGP